MMDEETHSLWDPLTGKAFQGLMQGSELKTWPIFYSTTEKELTKYPDTHLFFSHFKHPALWFFQKIFKPLFGLDSGGLIPPHFYRSMSAPIDPRLPKLTQGLGVVAENRAKYYPLDLIFPGEVIQEKWNNKTLIIERADHNTLPVAIWKNTDNVPMQIMSRWYGFAFTYPQCEIYQDS